MLRTLLAPAAMLGALSLVACSPDPAADVDAATFGDADFCAQFGAADRTPPFVAEAFADSDAALVHLLDDPDAADALEPITAYIDRMDAQAPAFEDFLGRVADGMGDADVAAEVRAYGTEFAAATELFAASLDGADGGRDFVERLVQLQGARDAAGADLEAISDYAGSACGDG